MGQTASTARPKKNESPRQQETKEGSREWGHNMISASERAREKDQMDQSKKSADLEVEADGHYLESDAAEERAKRAARAEKAFNRASNMAGQSNKLSTVAGVFGRIAGGVSDINARQASDQAAQAAAKREIAKGHGRHHR